MKTENTQHFLTIKTKPNKEGIAYEYELCWDDEEKKVIQVINKHEDNAVLEEFSIKQIGINDFAVNIDRYMNHPGITFSDEKFVEELMKSYIFDTEIFD